MGKPPYHLLTLKKLTLTFSDHSKILNIMHFAKIVLALSMLVMLAESTFIITGTGLGLAALFGLKLAAFKGFAIGAALSRSISRSSGRKRYYGRSYMKKRRYGRSVEDNDGLADILL